MFQLIHFTMMSIFLTTFFSLTFVLNLDVNKNIYQDYFIFHGNDTSAHLFRENNTINLVLMSDENYVIYQSNVTNSFIFEWDGFIINDEKMKLRTNQLMFDVNQLTFYNYTFISSFSSQDIKTLTLEDTKELFQELIVAVVLDIILIGVIFRSDILRSDSLIRKAYDIFKIIFNKKYNVEFNEEDYAKHALNKDSELISEL